MKPRTWTELWRLAGSAWSVSLSYWAVVLAITTVSSTVLVGLSRADVSLWSTALSSALASLLALAAVALWRVIRRWFWAERFAPAWSGVLIGALVGAVRGFTLFLLVGLFNQLPIDPLLLVQLAIPSTIQNAVVMPLLGILGAVVAGWDAARTQLVRAHTAERMIQHRELGSAAPDRVLAFLSDIETQVAVAPDARLGLTLAALADGEVRQLSSQLWEPDEELPRFTVRNLVGRALRHHRFPANVLASVTFVSLLFAQAFYAGFATGALRALVQSAAIWLIAKLASKVVTRSAAAGVSVWIVTVLVTSVAIFAVSFALFPDLPGFPVLSSALSFVIGYGWFALTVGAVAEGIDLSRAISAGIDLHEAEVAQLVGRRVNAMQHRDAARVVHGTLQRSLRGLAVRADAGENPQQVRTELARALGAAHQQLAFGDLATNSLSDTLDGIASRWAGIVDVATQSAVDEVTSPEAALLGELIEESVSNAHRHGGADRVSVKLEGDFEELRLDIVDNGTPGPERPPGLGTALCEAASHGNWSRLRSDTGTTLRLVIPRE